MPRGAIAGLIGKNIFSSVRNYQLSSKVTVPFCILPAMNESSCCSTFSPAFDVVSVPDFGHSNRCIVVSHCCFNLQYPMTYNVEQLFTCLFALCVSSLVQCINILFILRSLIIMNLMVACRNIHQMLKFQIQAVFFLTIGYYLNNKRLTLICEV